uniref:Cation/H+ exchanger transmembrane domain-containing protein n=1 Tax=Chromera velia CCMP2878 TaxID=1169474 RepID=A0A0G4HC41_9ALVE|eukprot:Cvel_26104.t1-p1 / transcript=Cvel_26104.t1 / gene=Cvel_26104 / organism=Chromera_velia_CCMP2878 / gene_product=Mitochondrial sodium/hydrogen exchanger 9B2, putative / transcript_product=Mitochondrial sodium/hydrogen exchanger 9B2, putative / location=Cvel_scaffold3052:1052-19050(-) / protein_length=1247 / sequence_SO=supercontig / SO=protein_coding / is_pseudo=false
MDRNNNHPQNGHHIKGGEMTEFASEHATNVPPEQPSASRVYPSSERQANPQGRFPVPGNDVPGRRGLGGKERGISTPSSAPLQPQTVHSEDVKSPISPPPFQRPKAGAWSRFASPDIFESESIAADSDIEEFLSLAYGDCAGHRQTPLVNRMISKMSLISHGSGELGRGQTSKLQGEGEGQPLKKGVTLPTSPDEEEVPSSRRKKALRPNRMRTVVMDFWEILRGPGSLEIFSGFFLFLIFYIALAFAVGPLFIPLDGPFFACALLWTTAHAFAFLFQPIQLPPLLGMLLAGIFLRNVPGDPVRGLTEDWGEVIRIASLCIILTRSGLELDIGAFKKIGWIAARLTACPGVAEAIGIGLLASLDFFFGMPVWLGLSLGFILGAVSPAVVVGGMFELQKQGYGVEKGIPSLVVAAASFDDVLAITGYSVAIGLALGQGELYMNILHGPLVLIGGFVCGIIVAFIVSLTKLWNSTWKRALALISLIWLLTFGMQLLHYNAVGYLASVVGGLTVSVLWARGIPKWGSTGPGPDYGHEVESKLAQIWKYIAQPLLFSVIGAALDFKKVKGETIPLAIFLVFLGLCIRIPVALGVLYGGPGLTFNERAFVALSWMPKATVQAALATAPLDQILSIYDETDPNRDQWIRWGEQILTTAIFSVILTAPIGLLIVSFVGQKMLNKDFQTREPQPTPKILPETEMDASLHPGVERGASGGGPFPIVLPAAPGASPLVGPSAPQRSPPPQSNLSGPPQHSGSKTKLPNWGSYKEAMQAERNRSGVSGMGASRSPAVGSQQQPSPQQVVGEGGDQSPAISSHSFAPSVGGGRGAERLSSRSKTAGGTLRMIPSNVGGGYFRGQAGPPRQTSGGGGQGASSTPLPATAGVGAADLDAYLENRQMTTRGVSGGAGAGAFPPLPAGTSGGGVSIHDASPTATGRRRRASDPLGLGGEGLRKSMVTFAGQLTSAGQQPPQTPVASFEEQEQRTTLFGLFEEVVFHALQIRRGMRVVDSVARFLRTHRRSATRGEGDQIVMAALARESELFPQNGGGDMSPGGEGEGQGGVTNGEGSQALPVVGPGGSGPSALLLSAAREAEAENKSDSAALIDKEKEDVDDDKSRRGAQKSSQAKVGRALGRLLAAAAETIRRATEAVLVALERAAHVETRRSETVVYKDTDTAGNFFALVRQQQEEKEREREQAIESVAGEAGMSILSEGRGVSGGQTESLNPLFLYDESINEFQKVTALQIPVHCTVPQR